MYGVSVSSAMCVSGCVIVMFNSIMRLIHSIFKFVVQAEGDAQKARKGIFTNFKPAVRDCLYLLSGWCICVYMYFFFLAVWLFLMCAMRFPKYAAHTLCDLVGFSPTNFTHARLSPVATDNSHLMHSLGREKPNPDSMVS